jgi:phosphoglycolate phosphatase-like HAD superfamily hydrolase
MKTIRDFEHRGRTEDSKLVAMLDIYDTQLQYTNGVYMHEMAWLKEQLPRESEVFNNPEHPEFGTAYRTLLNRFDDAILNRELELEVIPGVPETLEHLSKGFHVGAFSLASDFSINYPLQEHGLARYYNAELLLPVSRFGFKASKSKVETWLQMDEYLKSRGYKLGIFVDDNVKAVKAVVKSGLLQPNQAFHIKRDYAGPPEIVEDEGIKFVRISSLAEIPKVVRYAEMGRTRQRAIGEE